MANRLILVGLLMWSSFGRSEAVQLGLESGKVFANDNLRLPGIETMAADFQPFFNYPIPFFLAQRAGQVDLIDLALVLVGASPRLSDADNQLMHNRRFSALDQHVDFLTKRLEGRNSGRPVLNGPRLDAQARLYSSELALLEDFKKLSALTSRYLGASTVEQAQIRIQAITLRQDMEEHLARAKMITGDFGESVSMHLLKNGIETGEIPPVEVEDSLTFTGSRARQDQTRVLFRNMAAFLQIPERAFFTITVGSSTRSLRPGAVVSLKLNDVLGGDMDKITGEVTALTYKMEFKTGSVSRILSRDRSVWSSMYAYLIRNADGTETVVPESKIDRHKSTVTARACAYALSALALVPGE